MRRVLVILAGFAMLSVPVAGAKDLPTGPPKPNPTSHKATAPPWALSEIKLVVSHGLMSKTVAAFHPDDTLTQGALGALVAGLTHQTVPAATAPATPVTMAQLDARLVRGLGLSDAAGSFYRAIARAGLAPPSRFGTEAVARMLGLRLNHPASQDALELLPSDPATRAEAAYSAAQVLGFGDWQTQSVADASTLFTLPQLTPWQKRILTTAVRFIGYPYVWGGTSELPEAPFGIKAHGGFDCSGFVWRVYKLQAYPSGAALATTLRGRTTYAMSGEVPRAKRIPFARLAPGDLLFWGAHGSKSSPNEIDHTGIYLGSGWFIHSSRYGVAIEQLSGWYRQRFAWGRRPLAEAGLQ